MYEDLWSFSFLFNGICDMLHKAIGLMSLLHSYAKLFSLEDYESVCINCLYGYLESFYTCGPFYVPRDMLHELTLCKCACLHVLAWRGFQYPSIAEEIKSVASADPALRKLFVRGLAWNTTSETLCAVSELLPVDCFMCSPGDCTLWYESWSLNRMSKASMCFLVKRTLLCCVDAYFII